MVADAEIDGASRSSAEATPFFRANGPASFSSGGGQKVDVAETYTSVAGEYAAKFFNELDHKPKVREILDAFAEAVGARAPVCDVGCGPGHVTRYLNDRGLTAFGLDISAGMCDEAKRLNPHLEFRQGDLLATGLEDDSLDGVVALYSIIHIPPERVVAALVELRRVLRPGGTLLLSHHLGQRVVHLADWFGKPVDVDFFFYSQTEMTAYLNQGGFEVTACVVRAPYDESIEARTERAYFSAKKPEPPKEP